MNADESQPSCWTRRAVLLCLALFVFYLCIAAGTDLFDRDEPRFARAAVEMVGSGDYLVPHFNGKLRPDKPVLVYWLMSGPVRLLGATEVAVRLPSCVCMAISVWLTFLIGRRVFTPRVGFEGAAMFGTSLLVLWLGSAATADSTLLAGMVAALWPFVDRLCGRARWWHLPVMGLALGWALLAKGPVGMAVPGLTMIGTAVLLRKSEHRVPGCFWRDFAAAVVIGLGIFVAWGLPAAVATDWAIAKQGLGKHVGERMVSAQEGHGGSGVISYILTLPLYIPLIIVCFFPWTLHLPGGLSALIRRHVGDARSRALLWGWIVPTFVLMSLVVTKLPHYVIGIYPALGLLCAATLDAKRREALGEKDRAWLRGGVWFFGPVAWGVALALGAGAWWVSSSAGMAGLMPAAALAIVIVFAWRAQVHERVEQSTRLLLIGTPVLVLAVVWMAGPQIKPAFQISKPLAAAAKTELQVIKQQAGEDVRVDVGMAGYQEPSLVFYLNRPFDQPVEAVGVTPQHLSAWASRLGPGVLIVRRAAWERAVDKFGSLGLTLVAEHGAVNYASRARAESVVVLRRNGGGG